MIKLAARLTKYSILLGGSLYLVNQSIYDVDGGKRAVIWDRFTGITDKIVGEGTHLKVPFFQYPYIFDIRIKQRVQSTISGTKDLQNVNVTIRVLSRPEEAKLPKIYKSLGMDYDERVLPAICNEVMKSIVAHREAEQLLTNRQDFYRELTNELTTRAAKFNILIEDVAIVDLQFGMLSNHLIGKEFTHAIEQKVVAQQQAEMAKFVVQRSEQEKKAEIIRAEGESQSAILITDALYRSGAGLIEIRKLEAARDIAKILANANAVTYLPGKGGNVLLNLPTN